MSDTQIVPEAVLYTNTKGQPVTHASYSARSTFGHCPREFELSRVQGWWDKTDRAAPLFGKCVEAGVQAYEESGRVHGRGVTVFEEMWAAVKEAPNFAQLVFTGTENNWDQLERAGREMQLLYEVRVPYLPISRTPAVLFQQSIRKKIFPGTHLDKLENKAILDMLSFPPWDHKRLPPATRPEGAPEWRSLIVDIKTSGGDLDSGLVCLDPQLAEYAWQLRIPDVAFLWFVKAGHGLKRGSRVSLLEDVGPWGAGFELHVVYVGEKNTFAGLRAAVDDYEKNISPLRGKAREAAELVWLGEAETSGKVVCVTGQQITKQRLQFAAARLTEKDMDDTGRSVAQLTVEMVRAHEQGYYEKRPGIRFPNEKCNNCSMRWICLNQPEERDKHLSKRGEEWLDGIQGEE